MLTKYIEEVFAILDSEYSAEWNTSGKGTRENLIAALSQTEVSPRDYLGYSSNQGFYHALSKGCSKLPKPRGTYWRDHLVETLLNKVICPVCYSVESRDKEDGRRTCKSCRYKKSNRYKLLEHLKSCKCEDCGETNPVVLEFDHTSPEEKSFNISDCNKYSWSTVLQEIDKCQVVCANCHRVRTAKQFGWYSLS